MDARALQLVGSREIADARACLLNDTADLAPAVRAGGSRLRAMARLLASRTNDRQNATLLAGVLAAESTHEQAFTLALGSAGAHSARPGAPSVDLVLARGDLLQTRLDALVDHVDSTATAVTAGARTAANRTEIILAAITLATLLLLVFLCVLLISGLSKSFRRQWSARTAAELDQTRAHESLKEVEAASHLKDEFLATVSHELRNPLAPILTWTQLLRSGTLDADKTRRALEVIERNVMSQAALIDDLVDVSRVVAGKFRLDVRPVDLAKIIKSAVDAQSPAVDAKQIRLQLVLDERAGMISGDSERLQQVMWNLMSNAIKFTPKGGRVQVVLQRAESHVEVSVSDSGVGIAHAFLPHVFEAFQQGTNGSMRRHGGLGLGLSIVRHIVELHGGEISAFSDGPDKGARFTIKFPLLATASDPRKSAPRHPIARDSLSEAHLGRLDDVRVLVVEDEPNASEALLVLFQSCGAHARSAGSVEEGLTIFTTWRPDVLVSDIAMPGEDGYSLIRKIRRLPPEAGGLVPAVALTAYAKIEDRVTILAAGFQMYLSKPADPNELVAVVGSLAKRRDPDVLPSIS